MREISLGILGLGNVGSSFISMFYERKKELEERYGISLRLVFACNSKGGIYEEKGIDLKELSRRLLEGVPERCEGWKPGLSGTELIERGADVVIEVTPTSFEEESPGMRHFKAAILMGSHVITSNKGPLALKFWELNKLAERRGVYLLFEGTVMSGTPVISVIRSLGPREISKIRGILNGTTNFILSKMEEGKSFSEALSEAISRGFAERNPEGDLKGYDAAAKITILADYCFGIDKSVEDVDIRGIEGISKETILEAISQGKKIKLVAEADREKLKVSPVHVFKGDPLFDVKGVENCVILEHDTLGRISIRGPGAGGKETAFALLSDLKYLLERIAPR